MPGFCGGAVIIATCLFITLGASIMATNTSAGIVSRLMGPKGEELPPEAADAILRLHFHRSDHARMDELTSKAQTGSLTNAEREELEEYLRVADFLTVFQLKARQSLQRAGQAT